MKTRTLARRSVQLFAKAAFPLLALVPLSAACSGVDAATKLPRDPYYDPDAAVEGGTKVGESDDTDDPVTTADAGSLPVPDIETIAWRTGIDIGTGVAMKDTGNPVGTSLFVAYGGFNVSLEATEAWASALYKATLQAKGVRYIWAVQGPAQSDYASLEIGNTKIGATMLPLVTLTTKFILIAAHSSGSFVAHEFLNQLANGKDPQNLTQGKIIYFNLDGGSQGASATTGLSAGTVGRLKKAYFVSPIANGTEGFNTATMQSLGSTYAASGGFFTVDSSASGCAAGNKDCVHISLVTTKPHNPAGAADPTADYADFAGRAVTTAYLDMKAVEAGLAL